MDNFEIEGGRKLSGSVKISGAKNAVLPILAASILTQKKSIIHNVPRLQDVLTMIRILEYIGAKIKFDNGDVEIDPSGINKCVAPYEFVKTMRASVSLLGPLVARFHKAEFSLPGGCIIGPRPIDLHIKGLQKLGVDIKLEEGYVIAGAKKGIVGNYVFLGGSFGSSVLATCNVLSAAVLAKGETVIEFAACEPEVVDLADFLNKMGAVITGAGSPFIRVEGVKKLEGVEYTIIPDRIETGTYLLAGAITGGRIKAENCQPFHLGAFLEKIGQTGISFKSGKNYIEIQGKPEMESGGHNNTCLSGFSYGFTGPDDGFSYAV